MTKLYEILLLRYGLESTCHISVVLRPFPYYKTEDPDPRNCSTTLLRPLFLRLFSFT